MKTPDIIVAEQEPKFLSILERVSEGYISPSEAFAEMRPLLLAALIDYATGLETERDNYKRSVNNAHAALDTSDLIQDRQKSRQGLTPRIKSLLARIAELKETQLKFSAYCAQFRREDKSMLCAPEDAAKRIMELEIKLAALGEFAVADWNSEVVGQVDEAVPEPTRYKDFLRTLFVKHPEQIKELQEEVAKLKAATISGFYEDESPQFRQGYPEHELEELVTAEEVTGYITKIRQLNAKITELLEQK